jgi:bifunctional non-homologous end joining protein LigD
VPPRQSIHRSPARFTARTLKGAKPAPFLGFVEPCLATLKDEPPAGPRWVHELKLDGYRARRRRFMTAARPSFAYHGQM